MYPNGKQQGRRRRPENALWTATALTVALLATPALSQESEQEAPTERPHCVGYEVSDLEAMELARQVQWLTEELAQCELTPTSQAIAYNNRGMAYYDLGDLEAAIEDFGRAAEADPSYSRALNNRGQARMELGEYELAVEDFTLAIAVVPNDDWSHHLRGQAHCFLGHVEDGVADILAAIRIDDYWSSDWQAFLAEKGFYEGEIDGKFGPDSEAALRAWCAG